MLRVWDKGTDEFLKLDEAANEYIRGRKRYSLSPVLSGKLANLIVQQSTGCLDADGELIYEGDILRDNERGVYGGGILGLVTFDLGGFNLRLACEGLQSGKLRRAAWTLNRLRKDWSGRLAQYVAFQNLLWQETNIAGNVLENPDWLRRGADSGLYTI